MLQPRKVLASWPRSAKWLIALAPVVAVGFIVICASVLIEVRRSAWQLALQSSDNLVAAVEADIARNVELYDLSLQAVVDGVRSAEVQALSPRIRNLVLFDRAATAEHFGPIQVLDADGKVVIDSQNPDPEPVDHAQEEYFARHRDMPDAGLFISGPLVLPGGEHVIALSRRLSAADGSFAGIVVGTMRLSYFHDLFRRVQFAPDDVLSLVTRDGVILVRMPFRLEDVGKTLPQGRVMQLARRQEVGWVEMKASLDGVDRLYVWRAGKTPFIVTAGRSLRGVYADWRNEALQIGALICVLSLLMAGLTVALARELKRRAAVEQELQRQARTDALTGVHNRRHLDELLDKEWNRCRRRSEPLALLMVDADYFKAFNDQFGHQAGDLVLVGIASTIAGSLRRSADCAARYGGEEFAVLLPGMSHAEAYEMAERVREAVQRLPFERPVTVSIGVASVVPCADLSARDLVSEADAALYDAKARGRNQTSPPPRKPLRVAA